MPFLAASPDGILDDESLVEIKCPASAKELASEDAIQNNKINCCSIKDGKLFLIILIIIIIIKFRVNCTSVKRLIAIFVYGPQKVNSSY